MTPRKKSPAKKSTPKSPAKKSPAKTPTKKSPAKTPTKKSPAKKQKALKAAALVATGLGVGALGARALARPRPTPKSVPTSLKTPKSVHAHAININNNNNNNFRTPTVNRKVGLPQLKEIADFIALMETAHEITKTISRNKPSYSLQELTNNVEKDPLMVLAALKKTVNRMQWTEDLEAKSILQEYLRFPCGQVIWSFLISPVSSTPVFKKMNIYHKRDAIRFLLAQASGPLANAKLPFPGFGTLPLGKGLELLCYKDKRRLVNSVLE